MKLLVVGAAGKTGRLVADQAVAAGHEVTVLLHSDRTLDLPGVAVQVGDARDLQVAEAAVAGQDAVIDTVGGRTPYRRTTLETDVTTTLIQAMQRHEVRRLVVTSSVGVGDSVANCSIPVRIVVATFLRASTRDKAAMEAAVRDSGLDWVITRPAVLTEGSATGNARALFPEGREKAAALPRADLAAFLLARVTDDEHLRRAVTVAGG